MNQDFQKSRLSIKDVELSGVSYTLLAFLCKDAACAHVRSAEDGNGCQAWQALLRAPTARNATNLLNHLLDQTHESIFDDGTKMLRSTRHELVNAKVKVSEGQFTWRKVHHKTCDSIWYWISPVWARLKKLPRKLKITGMQPRNLSRDDKGQAGFNAPIGKGSAKGGKPKGVPYNFGKSGTKGKGKMHKGLGFQPEGGQKTSPVWSRVRDKKTINWNRTFSPLLRHRVPDRSRKDVSSAHLAICHRTPTSKFTDPVSWVTQSLFRST